MNRDGLFFFIPATVVSAVIVALWAWGVIQLHWWHWALLAVGLTATMSLAFGTTDEPTHDEPLYDGYHEDGRPLPGTKVDEISPGTVVLTYGRKSVFVTHNTQGHPWAIELDERGRQKGEWFTCQAGGRKPFTPDAKLALEIKRRLLDQ